MSFDFCFIYIFQISIICKYDTLNYNIVAECPKSIDENQWILYQAKKGPIQTAGQLLSLNIFIFVCLTTVQHTTYLVSAIVIPYEKEKCAPRTVGYLLKDYLLFTFSCLVFFLYLFHQNKYSQATAVFKYTFLKFFWWKCQ